MIGGGGGGKVSWGGKTSMVDGKEEEEALWGCDISCS